MTGNRLGTVQQLPGGGIGKLEGGGGIGENDNKREAGLDVKFNTYKGGHYFFIPFCKLEKKWESY